MKPLKILLIENQERYARLVLEQLRCCEDPSFEVMLHYQYDTAPSLISGKGTGFDIVLFGFQGEEDIPLAEEVLNHAEGKAIVMFLLKNNNKKTIAAVRRLGMARFLIKRDVQSRVLPRVLEYEMELARLLSQSGDEVVFDTQSKKVLQMVDTLLKEVQNPSSIVRPALNSLSQDSKNNGDPTRHLELVGPDIGQIKNLAGGTWAKKQNQRGVIRENRKVKPVHQKAV